MSLADKSLLFFFSFCFIYRLCLNRFLCSPPPGQRGGLRLSADESGLRELRHTAALCSDGEQDPAALAQTRRAHRGGRGRGGCE